MHNRIYQERLVLLNCIDSAVGRIELESNYTYRYDRNEIMEIKKELLSCSYVWDEFILFQLP